MEKIILDTSIVVKWFVEEKDSDKALKILADYQEGKVEIIVPNIVSLELANALFFGAGLKGKVLEKAVGAFYNLGFILVPLTEAFIQGAKDYMEKFEIAIYDASFIYLAEKEKTPLVTADKKHHSKKFSKWIRYL